MKVDVRSVVHDPFAACASALASASTPLWKVTCYSVYHFGHYCEGKRVAEVHALAEARFSDGRISSGGSVMLRHQGQHFFVRHAAVFRAYHSSVKDLEPKELRVRYVVYLKDNTVAVTPSYPLEAGPMYSLHGKTDQEKEAIRREMESRFEAVRDADATRNLFFVNDHSKNFFR
ncbi:hypothetical protein [Sorangium sp. So ce1335]|uniref:hypothetical protein n=1 Tax=Sorangium sp. So ce1335 TaxID=3133335 RepID=UPI003F62FB89